MKETVSILGVHFQRIRMEEAVQRAFHFLESEGTQVIYTPNPEIVIEAYKDPAVLKVLNAADMLIPDGIGVVIGSRIIGKPLPERVAGYDLTQNLFEKMNQAGKSVYFLGAAPGVADTAAQKMQIKYPKMKIIGTHDGYFKPEESEKIVTEINRLNPDLLLVGLGAPRQEKWIQQYKNQLNAKLCIGVGGSFDGMADIVKRAPAFFIKLNLEWFYRLLCQPTRFKRMLRLPYFLILMIIKGRSYT